MQKFRPQPGDKGLPVLKIRELGQGECGPDADRCSIDIEESVRVHDGDLIFSWSGTLLLDFWAGGEAGLNQHLFKVTSNKYPSWFYYMWTKHHMKRFIAMAKDRATTMGHIKRSALANAQVIIPPQDLLARQTKLMQPVVDQMIGLKVESKRLAEFRDALLPRLMSGEIDVSQVEMSTLPNSHLLETNNSVVIIFIPTEYGVMPLQVNKSNITQLLTMNNTCFMIPVYQRNYDWSIENCKQLWQDIWYISQNPGVRTHFLGTICSKSVNSREKTIIDGQQRITTITLLMKAMHDSVDDIDFKKSIDETFLRNTGYGVTPAHKVKLHLNRRDDEIYNELLQSDESQPQDLVAPEIAESNIYKNYKFFMTRFDGLTDEVIVGIRDALDRIIIVDLDVESENPQEIFESLNSTGLDLTDVDLLRNFLLMSLPYDTQVHLYDDYWYKIEENVQPANMVRFFVDYLIYTKRSDSVQIHGRRAHINENNLYVAFKEYYKSLSGEQDHYSSSPEVTNELLKDMYERSKTYRYLVFNQNIDMNSFPKIKRDIYSIVCLNEAIAARPILMFVMERHLNGTDTEAETEQMLDACLSLVFRAKITRSYGINGQFSGTVLQRLAKADSNNVVSDFWAALTIGSGRYAFPSDSDFYDALLSRSVFDVLRAKGTKYLFYTLEQHSIAAKGLPRYDDTNITIEHIMPKTLSQEWEESLGDSSVYHDDYLNKLGNLTLTSNNSEMSNKPFNDKKDWYNESSFSLTREITKYGDWSIAQIRERGERLAEKCLEVWPFPSEYQTSKFEENDSNNDPSDGFSKRRSRFKFSMVGLKTGDTIVFSEDPSKTATVSGDSKVLYNGETYSLSRLAAVLLGDKDRSVRGPDYFMYDGETLSEMREQAETNIF